MKRMCQQCGERRALFQYRGEVKADAHHSLCFRCYRAERNRQAAQRVSVQPLASRSAFDFRPELSEQEAAHRRRMLTHMERQSAASRVS